MHVDNSLLGGTWLVLVNHVKSTRAVTHSSSMLSLVVIIMMIRFKECVAEIVDGQEKETKVDLATCIYVFGPLNEVLKSYYDYTAYVTIESLMLKINFHSFFIEGREKLLCGLPMICKEITLINYVLSPFSLPKLSG